MWVGKPGVGVGSEPATGHWRGMLIYGGNQKIHVSRPGNRYLTGPQDLKCEEASQIDGKTKRAIGREGSGRGAGSSWFDM
jgi:hypothetical protein